MSFVYKNVWQSAVPLKISFLMLRLLQDRLPLASSIKRFGVHGPSKCFCCVHPNEESLDHIFSDGDLAEAAWNFLGVRLVFGMLGWEFVIGYPVGGC